LNLNQSGCDLVIMNKAEPPSFWQVMAELKETQGANQTPASLLVVQEPVWPLTKLLLVIRCNETSDAALNWVIKIAKPTRLAVTLQIVTPFLPTTYYDDYLRALMSTNTKRGNWYRSVRRQFEQYQIPSAVKIRQGEPDWQLKRELAENEYDLVVIAYKQTSVLKQWSLRDELVCSLMDHAGCPVLVA
jgi:nucleotide-binding universal stress UspA family protein